MTDVLNAKCVLIEDRVYRLLPIRDSLKKAEEEIIRPARIHYNEEEDDDIDPDLNIMHSGNQFYINFHVPASLIGFVAGAQHKNLKALEQQYDVTIKISGERQSQGSIAVSGKTKKSISSTHFSIMTKANTARFRNESTHFISLPVNSANIQESFIKFREEVLKKHSGVRGIDASIFQKPNKLHVTIAVLVLLDKQDRENARSLITKLKENVLKELGKEEFPIRVKGLEYMNDDPANVDILYAKLQELDNDNSLQIIADKIMQEFVGANLARKQHDRVKLHITLMNTLFREKLESNEADQERITFDAKPIFKDFKDYDFGETVISEIHISARYTENKETGFYDAIHITKLN